MKTPRLPKVPAVPKTIHIPFSISIAKIYLVIFVGVLALLTLPSFNFKVGETDINFRGVDLSAINPSFRLGEFRKGQGIYESTKLYSQITFDETILEGQREIEFQKILTNIENRRILSGLYDVEVDGEIIDGTMFIAVTIPDYYLDKPLIATMLTSKGDISFTKNLEDQNAPEVSLQIEDVEGAINTSYNESYGNVLDFRFKESALLNLTLALNSENGYFLMSVDSLYYAVIGNPNVPGNVFAVPFAEVQSSESSFILNRIVKSYFAAEPLTTQTAVIEARTQILQPEYKNDRIRNGIYAFTLVLLVILAGYVLNRGKRNAAKFILSLGAFAALFIVLLKFSYAVLSIELVLGATIALILFGNMLFTFITSIYRQEDSEVLKSQRMLAFGILIVTFLIYKVAYNLIGLVDILGALTIGSLTYLILSYIFFNFIKDEDFF